MHDCSRRLSVSVIIPTYNRADLLIEAIESALNQTRIPDEIVVVDDGSTDDTQDVLSRFGPPVRTIWQPNQRLSAARNRGMEIASGDVFLYLDSDDLLLTHCVERTVGALEMHPDVDVVYSDCYLIDRQSNRLGVFSQAEPGPRPSGMILQQLGYRWYMINPSSTAVRRTALGGIEFDEDLSCSAEDFEFWRRLAVNSKFLYLDEILACYRFHDAQITSMRADQLLEGAIEVQRRIMNMDEFNQFSRSDKARLYCIHGVKHAELGRGRAAKSFFWRSACTSPGYLPAHVLLLLGLFGARPLQGAIRLRRQWLRPQLDNIVGTRAVQEPRQHSADEVPAIPAVPPICATR